MIKNSILLTTFPFLVGVLKYLSQIQIAWFVKPKELYSKGLKPYEKGFSIQREYSGHRNQEFLPAMFLTEVIVLESVAMTLVGWVRIRKMILFGPIVFRDKYSFVNIIMETKVAKWLDNKKCPRKLFEAHKRCVTCTPTQKILIETVIWKKSCQV